jgi:branched-subunit amino acid transport protein
MTLRPELLPYLLVMAGVTYLIRALPLVLCRRKIQNRYLLSFLYYMPYAVLSAMTVPAIFFATESILAASAGFLVALVLAFFKRSLITVASGAVVGVLLTSLLEAYVFPL